MGISKLQNDLINIETNMRRVLATTLRVKHLEMIKDHISCNAVIKIDAIVCSGESRSRNNLLSKSHK